MTTQTIDTYQVEIDERFRPAKLDECVRKVVDPNNADETIHWGRNYLYRMPLPTETGTIDVVVKQFSGTGLRNQLQRPYRGTKAWRAWRMAHEYENAGVQTATPLLLVESIELSGPSWLVTEHLPDRLELRYLLEAMNEGRLAEEYSDVDIDSVLDSIGRVCRRMHDAGLIHRDLSIGNVLLDVDEDGTVETDRVAIIDLNRSRLRSRLGTWTRLRDLCRLLFLVDEHRESFFRAYQNREMLGLSYQLWLFFQGTFRAKIASKAKTRKALRRIIELVGPRRVNDHIPPAPEGVGLRNKSVWDELSDQPHQHAGKLEKTMVRLADAPSHLRHTAIWVSALPRVRKRYRELLDNLWDEPVKIDGVGVCVRPHPDDPPALLRAIDGLGVRNVLLRLHPWQDEHDEEEELARALKDRGCDLTFALPQNRDLVRDPDRWCLSIEHLGKRFAPYGRRFQIGQAVNRSKWGVWSHHEWLRLVKGAADSLSGLDAELIGPSVIDFELQAAAALVNLPELGFEFDAMASLLYVDRRGAPENTQSGFDTLKKAALTRAIADTAKWCKPSSWITEVNWPLSEGPHAPAGKNVAVSEQHQADYLVRFYLWTLATGMAERVYWWQLVARGYGLMKTVDEGRALSARSSYSALATLDRNLTGWMCIGSHETGEQTVKIFRFRNDSDEERWVGWTLDHNRSVTIPRGITRVVELDGTESPPPDNSTIELGSSVRYIDVD